jgi:uncharacterized membrane protein YidH (DUF202 family)
METVELSNAYPDTVEEPLVAAKRFRLGVLLVHGIGTQPPRDTLVRWGDVLMKTICRATKNQGQVEAMIERGRPGDDSGDQPAEIEILIRADGEEERWLLAEGWWAGSFPAPTYRELVSWSVRAVPWSIAIHIAQRYWQEQSRGSVQTKFIIALVKRKRRVAALRVGTRWVWAKLIPLVIALGQLLVALALAPVFIFLLALALLLGLLPIPQLRTVILSAQSTLTGTVGDSLAFVESPVRAAFIKTRILEGLERLKETCDHTLIVAHSQGAAVVLSALGGIMESTAEDDAKKVKPDSGAGEEPPPDPESGQEPPLVPDTLLTFGSGVNQLASLKRLSAGLPKTFGFNPVNAAIVTLLATLLIFGWLYTGVYSQRTTVKSILLGAVVFICLMVIGGVLMLTLTGWLSKRAEKQKEEQKEQREDWATWVTVAVVTITVITAVIVARTLDLPFGSVSFLFLALLSLAGSLKSILSSNMKEVVSEGVRKPPGLPRWIDLYASADPVPHGKTRVVKGGRLKSVQIWNLGSFLSDHTAYWDNLDGFVLRVARECAQTAQCDWRQQFRSAPRALDDRRAIWRVSFLRLARWGNGLAWLGALVLLLSKGYEQRVPVPFDLPAWLPPSAQAAARYALLAAIVAVAAWATFYIQCWFWSLWVRAEQDKTLNGESPSGRKWATFFVVAMELIVGLPLILVSTMPRVDLPLWSGLRADPRGVITEELIPIFVALVVMARVLAIIIFRLMPEPKPKPRPAATTGQ